MTLSTAEIEKFKKRLLGMKRDLEQQVSDLESKPADFGDDVDALDEEKNEAETFGSQLGVAQALRERLANVSAGIQRIEHGDYGKCEKCGGAIENSILEIDPETRFCQQCKLNMGLAKK